MFILRDKLATVAPVIRVMIGDHDDKSTWEAEYSTQPTSNQLDQVAALIQAYKILTPEQKDINLENLQYLESTDWKILRHQDQLALGITTSLTDEQYTELLTQRQTARDAVTKEGYE